MIFYEDLVERYGSPANIARMLGVKQSALHYWRRESAKPIPAEYQLILAFCVDPECFKATAAEFLAFFPRYAGATDERLNPRGTRRGRGRGELAE